MQHSINAKIFFPYFDIVVRNFSIDTSKDNSALFKYWFYEKTNKDLQKFLQIKYLRNGNPTTNSFYDMLA